MTFLQVTFKKTAGKPLWREKSLCTQWCSANSDCDFLKDCWGNHCDHSGHTSAQTGTTFVCDFPIEDWQRNTTKLQPVQNCLKKTSWYSGGFGLAAKLLTICWCFESCLLQVNWLQWYGYLDVSPFINLLGFPQAYWNIVPSTPTIGWF